MPVNTLIRDLRLARGWSQGRLAEELCATSGRTTITREEVSRWERGVRAPGKFWLPHLAAVLDAPLRCLEAERVRRRALLRTAALAPIVGPPYDTASDLMASIASGDAGPLETVQTSHQTDLAVASLVSGDHASRLHLIRWMEDGGSDILRVNAAGILAKTPHIDLLDTVSTSLVRDTDARARYVTALTARTGGGVPALVRELSNAHDAGARWCSAYLLGRDGGTEATQALSHALRTEPVRENIRTIGLLLNGTDPCSSSKSTTVNSSIASHPSSRP